MKQRKTAKRIGVGKLLLNLPRDLPVFLPWQLACWFAFLSLKYHHKWDISWNLTHLFHFCSWQFGKEAGPASDYSLQGKKNLEENTFHKCSPIGKSSHANWQRFRSRGAAKEQYKLCTSYLDIKLVSTYCEVFVTFRYTWDFSQISTSCMWPQSSSGFPSKPSF